MKSEHKRDSFFEITPWQQESSRLPQKLLQTQEHYRRLQANVFQTSTQSIYSPSSLKVKSPIIRPKSIKHVFRQEGSSFKPIRSTLSLFPRGKDMVTQWKVVHQHPRSFPSEKVATSLNSTLRLKTGNRHIEGEFITARTNQFQMQMFSPKSLPKNLTKDELSENLARIYQRSTLTSDLKKQKTDKSSPINRIQGRKKLKTEKQRRIWEDEGTQCCGVEQFRNRFQLLMERKLYMMKKNNSGHVRGSCKILKQHQG